MKDKKKQAVDNELGMGLSYALMVVICVYFTSSSEMDNVSKIINLVFFVIVGVIYLLSFKKFKNIESLANDLKKASEKITFDSLNTKEELWPKYKEDASYLELKTTILDQTYKDFIDEMKRLERKTDNHYKCDINDFINRNMVDDIANKNMLNLVAGTMTGLGILGTFVGLTIGLQSFSTGSAAEIEESIPALMNGIKVAFHTSIYGMFFSLTFNYFYKRIMQDAYEKLEIFVNAYTKYITNDSINDNESQIRLLIKEMPEQIGQQMFKLLGPAFDNMTTTLSNFANNVSKNQLEGLGKIVDSFIEQMNKSLGDNFKLLGDVIKDTCELQKQNNDFMQSILKQIADMTQNIIDINDLSNKTVDKMANFVSKVDELQGLLNSGFDKQNDQMAKQLEIEKTNQEYIDKLASYEKEITETLNQYTQNFITSANKLMEEVASVSATTKEELSKSSGDMNQAVINLNAQMVELFKQIFAAFDSNLTEVSKSINASITGYMTEITNYQQAVIKTTDESGSNYASTISKLTDEISVVSSVTARELNKSTTQLTETSEKLNGQLIETLNRTFETFDSDLAQITKHLSGTISEVDSTTQRIPQVVSASYDGLEKTFDEMHANFESFIHSMDIMQRNLQRYADKMKEE